MVSLLLGTAACMAAGLLLRGLPGAAFMALASPLLRILYGRDWLRGLKHQSWPVARRISLAWPLAILPAVRLAPRLGPFPTVAAPVFIALWGVLVAILFVALGRRTVAREAGPGV